MSPKKKTVLDISSATIVRIILICLFFFFLFLIRDIIWAVLAAVVIASAIEPLTIWLVRRGVKRIFAAIIIYLSLALAFMGIVFFFLPQFLKELSSFLGNISDYMNLAELPSVSRGADLVGNPSTLDQISSSFFTLREIIGSVGNSFTNTSQGFFESIWLVFGGFLGFILITVLSFYLAVQKDGVADFLRIITPLKYETKVIDLWRRSQRKIGLWMQGQILLGFIVGVLVYFGLLIFGVPHAFLLAVIAALFEIIPIFGPIFSAIPGILIAAGVGGITFALGVALLYFVIQQLESHFVYPLVVKKIVGISPIVVILALVIGAKLGGFLGVLLSVPIASVFVEYLNDVEKDKQVEPPVSDVLIL
ncbi:MAG: AI-2E family transporter [Candidatus Taylorbacteria bacterium]